LYNNITNPFAPLILPYLYFHRRFIEPSIFVFLDAICQIQTVNYIKIRHISDVAPQSRTEKEKLDFLFDLWRKYQSGQITMERYISVALGTNIRLERTCEHLLFIMRTVITRLYIVLFPIVLN